jgi:hypothetical protein
MGRMQLAGYAMKTNSGGGFVYFASFARLLAGDLPLEREGRPAQVDSNRRPCNLTIYWMQAGATLGYGFFNPSFWEGFDVQVCRR